MRHTSRLVALCGCRPTQAHSASSVCRCCRRATAAEVLGLAAVAARQVNHRARSMQCCRRCSPCDGMPWGGRIAPPMRLTTADYIWQLGWLCSCHGASANKFAIRGRRGCPPVPRSDCKIKMRVKQRQCFGSRYGGRSLIGRLPPRPRLCGGTGVCCAGGDGLVAFTRTVTTWRWRVRAMLTNTTVTTV